MNITTYITLEVEHGLRHYFIIAARTMNSLFGSDPETIESVEDTIIQGYPHRVPKVLALLRQYLVAGGGLKLESIFRQSGVESETKTLRSHLAKGEWYNTTDLYSVATLIKVKFKVKILSPLFLFCSFFIYLFI